MPGVGVLLNAGVGEGARRMCDAGYARSFGRCGEGLGTGLGAGLSPRAGDAVREEPRWCGEAVAGRLRRGTSLSPKTLAFARTGPPVLKAVIPRMPGP